MNNKTWYCTFEERKEQENKDFNIIVQFFEKSWYFVNDVHDNSDYFNKDIDLIISNDWKEYSVEIKFDDYIATTNNFFFEIVSNEEKSTAWCFLKSEADFLFYYDTINKIWYSFWMKKLKDWFFNVRNKLTSKWEIDKYFRLQSTHTKWENWKYHHTTIWRLVDKDFLFKLLDEDNIEYRVIKLS